MVWHAYKLNPQCYLEDCLRFGNLGMVKIYQLAATTLMKVRSFLYTLPMDRHT